MIKHLSFDAAYSLSDLQRNLHEYEGLRGRLVAIGNQAGETIGSFDRRQKKAGSVIVLRPGKPIAVPPGAVIDTDTVYIAGQLQIATAYRATADADTNGPATTASVEG